MYSPSPTPLLKLVGGFTEVLWQQLGKTTEGSNISQQDAACSMFFMAKNSQRSWLHFLTAHSSPPLWQDCAPLNRQGSIVDSNVVKQMTGETVSWDLKTYMNCNKDKLG